MRFENLRFFCRLSQLANKSKASSGHSLIELMLASFVFTVGALGLASLIYTSAQGVTASADLTASTTLARNKLDELIRLPFDDAQLTVGEHLEGDFNIDAQGIATLAEFGSADGGFARSWVITSVTSEYKSIIVNVRFYDKNKKVERQVQVVGGRSGQ